MLIALTSGVLISCRQGKPTSVPDPAPTAEVGQAAAALPSATSAETPESTTRTAPTPLPPTPEIPLDLPTPTPPMPPTLVEPSIAELTVQLTEIAAADLPPGEAGGTFEGVQAIYLTGMDGDPLWAAFSYGLRSFDPLVNHVVAIYQRGGGAWQEVSRLPLENPDYLSEHGVQQALLGGEQIWLEVNSGVGAHGGCYDLLRFDGTSLRKELSHCHSSPAAVMGMGDLDGNGEPDLVLNQTIEYIFCYACGVRLPRYSVMSWDGSSWRERTFEQLPETSAQAAANNRAVELARAGLWRDAAAMIDSLDSQEPAVVWNQALIQLYVEALLVYVEMGSYPLLNHLFYGDYEAVLELMREYPAGELLATPNPLIVGTAAEGWEADLSQWIVSSAEAALTAEPDLAPAHFMRGWGIWLADPGDPAAIPALERAAELAPGEALYSDSLAYLGAE